MYSARADCTSGPRLEAQPLSGCLIGLDHRWPAVPLCDLAARFTWSGEVEPLPAASRRILIVDDNYDGAESLAMLLEEFGHETRQAHDSLEALDAAERLRPEAVLLDIGLPKLNGYEVCQRLREQPWGQALMIVALTGWGQDEDRKKSQDAGFDTHLVEPIDLDHLMKLLASLPLHGHGGAPAATT